MRAGRYALSASRNGWSLQSHAATIRRRSRARDESLVRYGKVTSTDMSVSGATPDSATQDTTLDVVITGSGFVAGTAANWALAGVQDPGQVRTNSTRYVNSRQLVANITISSLQRCAKWDIVVTAAGKKGGIGTEMFAIKTKALAGACGGPTTYLDSRVRLEWSSLADLGSSSGMTSDGSAHTKAVVRVSKRLSRTTMLRVPAAVT